MANPEWNDTQPIYRQIHERVIAMLLDGVLDDGQALPSVRTVASDYRVNPLTVLKAYQQLADDRLIEKRRGLGMYVADGARERVIVEGREQFLRSQWPSTVATIRRLGLSTAELLAAVDATDAHSPEEPAS